MHGVKSAKLAISKVALLTPCMEVEIFCGQIPSFEVLWMCHYWTFSIMCLSFFQIQNMCQFWTKRLFSHFHSCFLVFSYNVNHLKAKFGMYFAQPSFCIFEWCVLMPLLSDTIYCMGTNSKRPKMLIRYFGVASLGTVSCEWLSQPICSFVTCQNCWSIPNNTQPLLLSLSRSCWVFLLPHTVS